MSTPRARGRAWPRLRAVAFGLVVIAAGMMPPVRSALPIGAIPSAHAVAAQGDATTTITTGDVTYVTHVYSTVGTTTFTPPAGVRTIQYLVVGGGGGGGSRYGGGGGGGGVLLGTTSVTSGTVVVTVGAGGAGGTNGGLGTATSGSDGSSSRVGAFVALGGGGGGTGRAVGRAGGSGGGGGGRITLDAYCGGGSVGTCAGGSGTVGQGYGGGSGEVAANNGPTYTNLTSGGGGGAGSVGGAASGTQAGAGGTGVSSSITGTSVTYGGGGGGGAYNANLPGLGRDGGGNGVSGDTAPTAAPANRGGGGGGGGLPSTGGNGSNGGVGGSGVVVIRYAIGKTSWYVAVAAAAGFWGSCASPDYATGVDTSSGAIQAAVGSAAQGDTIHLCAGTYELTSGITIATTGLTVEGDGSTATTVDGMGSVRIFAADGRTLTLRDLTLRRGSVAGAGGAVTAGSLDALRARFEDNASTSGTDDGGAVYATGRVAVTEGSFVRNASARHGGAIRAVDLVAVDTSFEANRAVSGGGAIWLDGALSLVGGAATDNSAGLTGGAVRVTNTSPGDVAVTGTTFTRNWTSASRGGAIWTQKSLEISAATFTDNTAGAEGGALYLDAAADLTLVMRGATLLRNVGTSGGAIKGLGSGSQSLRLVESTFTGNRTGAAGAGGAISATSSRASGDGVTIEITDGTFTGNSAGTEGGGAIATNLSGGGAALSVRAETTAFVDNTSGAGGGAILGSLVTLVESDFTANTAAATGNGGAVSASGALTIRGGTLSGNRAATGGAVYAGATASIDGARFVGNAAAANNGEGGAVKAVSAISVTDATFAGNVASGSPANGGAIHASSTSSIRTSTFVGNRATTRGGAIFAGGIFTVANSTFVENTAGGAAGAIRAAANGDVTHGTFIDNTSGSGGHIANAVSVTVRVVASVFAGGTCAGTITAVGSANIQTASGCAGSPGTVRSTLRLGSLGDNQGPTQTVPVGPGSVAIDTVSPCVLSTDQRGMTRPAAGGTACDSGAFEADRSLYVLPTSSPTWTYCPTPFASLADAVAAATSGDRIHLCAGVHQPGGTISVPASLSPLAIEGDASTDTTVAGNGTFTLLDTEATLAVRALRLSAGHSALGGGAIRGGSGATVSVDGVRFESSTAPYGGAIFAQGDVSVTDGVFTGNAATYAGGGIYGEAAVSIRGGSFADNTAGSGSGGAVFAYTQLAISDATFTRNRSFDGGGAATSFGAATVTNATFTGNLTSAYGGAMYAAGQLSVSGGSLTVNLADQGGGALYGEVGVRVVHASFSDNTSGGSGGAIYGVGGVSVSDATFLRNRATTTGGAIYSNGAVSVTEGTFGDNSAGTDGGAVYGAQGVSVSTGTFLRNRALAGDGGALHADGGGIAVAGGTFTSNTAGDDGGAVNGGLGAVAVLTSVFTRNSAGPTGGAIAGSAAMSITDATFTGNAATSGGAVFSIADIAISDGMFVGNQANGGSGGAVYSGGGAVTIRDGAFSDNTAGTDGGAIYAYSGISVSTGTFIGNRATAGFGGAIKVESGAMRVTDGAFTGNSSFVSGGAIYADLAISASDATFTDNSAGSDGGAIFANGGLSVSDGTFSGNAAGLAGGAICSRGAVSLQRTVVSANTAVYEGGGILATSGAQVAAMDASFVGNAALVGGAIVGTGGTVTVVGGAFQDNTASTNGGAIWSYGDVAVSDGTFRDNSAGADGGAIYGYVSGSAEITVTDGTFTGNHAAGSGGAILGGGRVSAVRSIFTDNTAGNGGAISAPTAELVGSAFLRNVATADGGGGGAINAAYLAEVADSEFTANTSAGYGGAIRTSLAHVRASTFTGNVAAYGGGGVFAGGGELRTSTFAENSTGSEGGAVYAAASGTLGILNATFVGNLAAGTGGAVFSAGSLEITHGTFVDNTAGAGETIDGGSTTVRVASSLFVGGACTVGSFSTLGASVRADAPGCAGTNTTRAALRLGTFGAHGGPTDTVELLAGSVAIDPTGGTRACVATDQRGLPRPASARCDAGAYEEQTPSAGATSIQLTASVTSGDLTAGSSITDGTRVTIRVWVGAPSEPTGGTARLGYCRSGSSPAPASCTDGTWVDITGGTLSLTDGTSGSDSLWEGTLEGWLPPGAGWYRIGGRFEPTFGGGAVAASDASADPSSPSFHVFLDAISGVRVDFGGPYSVAIGTAATVPITPTAVVRPATAGCVVRWDVSTGAGAAVGTRTGTSRSDGSVSASSRFDLSAGIYTVAVSFVSGCVGDGDPDGLIAVLPGSVSWGSVGSASYRATVGGPTIDFGQLIDVGASYNKRTGVTTTTTRVSFVWSVATSWRLRSTFTVSSTDGAAAPSPWQKVACSTVSDGTGVGTGGSGLCGYLAGTGTLQQWDVAAKAWRSSQAVWYRSKAYDGGSTTVCKGTGKAKQCVTQDLDDWFTVAEIRTGGPGGSLVAGPPTAANVVRLATPTGSGSVRNAWPTAIR